MPDAVLTTEHIPVSQEEVGIPEENPKSPAKQKFKAIKNKVNSAVVVLKSQFAKLKIGTPQIDLQEEQEAFTKLIKQLDEDSTQVASQVGVSPETASHPIPSHLIS